MLRLFMLLIVCSSLCACTNRSLELSPSPPPVSDCAGPVPSFRKDIQPIFAAGCAKAGCHDGNSMPHDFSQYAELLPVLNDSEVYYYVIKDRKMPEDAPLDSAQYHLVKCWIDNGYPDN